MMRAPLCFDATGTLIEMSAPVGDVYAEVAQDFGVELPAWRLDDAFARVMRHAPARGLEGDSIDARRLAEFAWWSERIRQTFQATDSTVRFEDFPGFARTLFETYREPRCWRLREGVRGTLDVLSRAGHPMCVVSNFDHRLPEILQALDLNDFFSSIEIPSTRAARKPDVRLFEAAADGFGARLDELVYIGDDAPETLAEIRRQGLLVLDIEELPTFSALPEWLASAATLPPPESSPSRPSTSRGDPTST